MKRPKSGTWFVLGVLGLFLTVVLIILFVLVLPRLDPLKRGRPPADSPPPRPNK